MDLIIDLQFFKDNKDRVVPKEVAIVALYKDFSAHWIIAPSCNTRSLKKYILRQNNWLTLNHHGLDWYEGDVTLKNFYKSLQDICKQAGKIYVRGAEKAKLLNKITVRVISRNVKLSI